MGTIRYSNKILLMVTVAGGSFSSLVTASCKEARGGIQGSGFRVLGLGVRVQVLGFRVQGSGCTVLG